ncbi:hypothetical protein MMMB2_0003 [Mycobacterium marinum MB2]|nr:hypothetical protein MMMB2_0003 [Mycobacterium marinum MB2]MBC9863800.1 hypothetical protein [Mycobacterium pseudoshottsii]
MIGSRAGGPERALPDSAPARRGAFPPQRISSEQYCRTSRQGNSRVGAAAKLCEAARRAGVISAAIRAFGHAWVRALPAPP